VKEFHRLGKKICRLAYGFGFHISLRLPIAMTVMLKEKRLREEGEGGSYRVMGGGAI
jgi:hypothetical protein